MTVESARRLNCGASRISLGLSASLACISSMFAFQAVETRSVWLLSALAVLLTVDLLRAIFVFR